MSSRYYQPTRNRLRPVPDPVIDITMNRHNNNNNNLLLPYDDDHHHYNNTNDGGIGIGGGGDVQRLQQEQQQQQEWLQHYYTNIKHRKPVNWNSQYTEYYEDLVAEQQRKELQDSSVLICNKQQQLLSSSLPNSLPTAEDALMDLETSLRGCSIAASDTATATTTNGTQRQEQEQHPSSCVYVPTRDYEIIEDVCYMYL